MARDVATLLLLIAYGSCMEMRETVERMVMVRTTGSDLQPAATGYIYKKESDGPASVTKMGETEVIEHFSKLYEKPEAYTASVSGAEKPLHTKGDDEDKAASYASEDVVKPVTEVDHGDDHLDGLATTDYDKMFEEYAKRFGNYKNDFADYLHGVGHFDHDIYHGYGGGKDFGSEGYHGHGEKRHEEYGNKHHFEKGEAGNHHLGKHSGYSTAHKGDYKHGYDEADGQGKHYADGYEYKGADHGHKAGHSKGEEIDGYHKVFDKDEFKKDRDFYDGAAVEGGHHKYADEHASHGSDAGGYEKGASHKSGHHKGGFEKDGYVVKQFGDEHGAGHSSEEGEESGHHKQGSFGIKDEHNGGKSFRYEVKH